MVKMNEKTMMTIIAILSGFVISSVAFTGIKAIATAPAAIGELKSAEDITVGTWFRYDIYPNVQTFKNLGWLDNGGLPYVIVECMNITTWEEINDTRHQDGDKSRIAFEWKITPYWQNGAEATELINGSVENTFWKYLIKPLRDGFYLSDDTGLERVIRPYIDKTFGEWTYAGQEPLNSAQAGFYFIITNYGAIDVKKFWMYPASSTETEIFEASATGMTNTTKDSTAYYDIDTGILYGYYIADWIGSSGYIIRMFMSGFGNATNAVGKVPPVPAQVTGEFTKKIGASYEYDLSLHGNFQTVMIDIESNDTAAFPDVDDMMITGDTVPIDITASVSLNVSIVSLRAGLESEPYNFSAILDLVNEDGKIENVTLLSADRIGNSIFLNWTSNPEASQYRVMLNDTMFGDVTVETQAYITPTEGIWNITIVCDSFLYNESSDPSNNIIVNYTVPVEEKAPVDYAVNPEDLGLVIVDHTTEIVIVIVIIVVIGAAVAFIAARPYLTGAKTSNRPSVSTPAKKRDGSRCLL